MNPAFDKNRLPAALLTACVVGAVLCPFVYITVGALNRFSATFSMVFVPPLVLGGGFLLWRYLSRPVSHAAGGLLMRVLEGLGWIAVLTFLFFVSGFMLLSTWERTGLATVFFLVGTAAALPWTVLRRTALEQRLVRRPRGVVLGCTLLILAAAAASAAVYLARPVGFM